MMSDRERWIVYPLLVLSLALGLKTHLWAAFGISKFNQVDCRLLVLKSELNEDLAVLQSTEQGGAEFKLASDGALAALTADPGGGHLLLMRAADRKSIVLGHDKLREISGLWAVEGNSVDSRLISLMIDLEGGAVWRLLPWPEEKEDQPADKKPAEKKEAQDDASP